MRKPVIALSELMRSGDEKALPLPVRLRIALDIVEALPDGLGPMFPRAPSSGLVPTRVTVGRDGRARLAASPKDTSGAVVLVWEVLAAKFAKPGPLGDLRDVIDDVPMDVLELVTEQRAAAWSAEELREALERASADHVGTHEDVARALVILSRRVQNDVNPAMDHAAWDEVSTERIRGLQAGAADGDLPAVVVSDDAVADWAETVRIARPDLDALEARAQRWAETVKINRPLPTPVPPPPPPAPVVVEPRSAAHLHAIAIGLVVAVVVALLVLRLVT